MDCRPSWPPSSAPEGGPACASAAAFAPGATCDAAAATAPFPSIPGEPIPVSLAAAAASKTAEGGDEGSIDAPEAEEGSAAQATTPEQGDLNLKAQMLLEMGLVSDSGVGLDLLRAQGGDLAQVAAMLVTERAD